MTRADILATAANLIDGDRAEAYGSWADNAEAIAARWRLHLRGRQPEARDVAYMLIDLKLVRESFKHSPDNPIDIAGYAALGGELDNPGD